jgi:hypothetical protein
MLQLDPGEAASITVGTSMSGRVVMNTTWPVVYGRVELDGVRRGVRNGLNFTDWGLLIT